MELSTKIEVLNRVGKSTAKHLARLGIKTAEDLLFYFPFRYEDYSKIVPIKEIVDGSQVTILGKIELIASKRSPRKRKIITEAIVSDSEGGRARIVWFGQPFISKILKIGDLVYFSGIAKSDMFGSQLVGPAYEKADKNTTTHTARIVPIYHLTYGLTQKQIRFLLSQVLSLADKISEWLPEEILDKAGLSLLPQAIKSIHFPENEEELKQAEKRIKFDELFILQLRAEMARKKIQQSVAPKIKFKEKETREFVDSLPYKLTKDQKITTWEILKDLEKNIPMNRMLEGDVGSGKTVVVAIAMYNAVLNGFQSTFMAPTEILAMQHYQTLSELFGNKLNIALLTHSQFQISDFRLLNGNELTNDKINKKEIIEKIKLGEVDIIIGTHALLSEKVEFKNLGFTVVDEQHRFGVEQRKILKNKNNNEFAHFLSMTATPIPRSLALTVYGDLDLSIIKEMPVGRKKIISRLVEPIKRNLAYNFIREQVKNGRQVFVVCPLIDEGIKSKEKGKNKEIKNDIDGNSLFFIPYSLTKEKKTVMSEYEKLSKTIFPDLRVSYLHGKMKPKEKEAIMEKFKNREIDILVSTSVVEVGVNIPNASVMMIENAERFGLAQLHQFRGRVGRSVHQSYCLLFTENESFVVKERLKYFEKNTDGFKLAEYDLERRGPGEVYGVEQSGMMNLRLAKMTDYDIIKLAREIAKGIVFCIKKYPNIQEKLKKWEENIHLE